MSTAITKRFTFEASHRLPNHDGKCSRNHGHSYKLFVTVEGDVLADETSPKDGMIMDFGDLSSIVDREIVSKWDHHFLAKGDEPELEWLDDASVHRIGIRTTAENMANLIFASLEGEGVEVCQVRLYETESSYATVSR